MDNPKKNIKCIAFDLGNVLITNGGYPKNALRALTRHFRLSFKFIFRRFDRLVIKMEAGNGSISDLIKDKRNKELDKFIFDFAEKYFKQNKFLLTKVAQLQKNYKIGIISNIYQSLSETNIYQQVLKMFDPKLIILSYKVGLRKPDIKIYEIFLKKVGCQPGECLFVDNMRTNLKTAKKMGMKTALFKNNVQFAPKLNKLLKEN